MWTFKIYKESYGMPYTLGLILVPLCVLKTWALKNSLKQMNLCDTWILLFKLCHHSWRIHTFLVNLWSSCHVWCFSRHLLGVKAHGGGQQSAMSTICSYTINAASGPFLDVCLWLLSITGGASIPFLHLSTTFLSSSATFNMFTHPDEFNYIFWEEITAKVTQAARGQR